MEPHGNHAVLAIGLPIPAAILVGLDDHIVLAIVLAGGIATIVVGLIFLFARMRSQVSAIIQVVIAVVSMLLLYLVALYRPPFTELGAVSIMGIAGTSFWLASQEFGA